MLVPLVYNHCTKSKRKFKEYMVGNKKMGRPVIGEPKNNKFQVRLTDTQLKKLDDCAKRLGKSKTDIVNIGIEMVYKSLDK